MLKSRKNGVVLLVDNDASELGRNATILKKLSYSVVQATTGSEAVNLLSAMEPAMVITAHELGDMSSRDLIYKVRRNAKAAYMPIVGLCPDMEDRSVKRQFADSGVLGCLYKPVDPDMLYKILQIGIEKTPRSSIRLKLATPIRLNHNTPDPFNGARIIEMSDGGMFVETDRPAPVASHGLYEFCIEEQTISTSAEVIYIQDQPRASRRGMGLRFIDFAERSAVRNFIHKQLELCTAA